MILLGCRSEKIPEAMIDAWVTDDPRYRGCYLLVLPGELVMGALDHTHRSYSIQKVKARFEDPSWEVAAWSADEEQTEYLFEYTFTPTGNGTLRLKNNADVIWYRSASAFPIF